MEKPVTNYAARTFCRNCGAQGGVFVPLGTPVPIFLTQKLCGRCDCNTLINDSTNPARKGEPT
jgi:hypothetical protein